MFTLSTAPAFGPLETIAQRHSALSEEYPKVFFKLTSNGQTGAVASLATECVNENPDRIIIKRCTGENLLDALRNMSKSKAKENRKIVNLVKRYRKVESQYDCSEFQLFVNKKNGWNLVVSSHLNQEHAQHKVITHVQANNMHDVLERGISQLIKAGY